MNQVALERTIRENWTRLAERAGFGSARDQALARLIAAYSSPRRHYHNLVHIHECLDHTRLLPKDVPFYDEILAAIWFHDVIYDSEGQDNELKSAQFAAVELKMLGASESFISTVSDLILNTQHRQLPSTEPGRYIVDIDLAILGAAPDRFDEYERDIRKEYSHVNDVDFRNGRSVILKRFIERDSIYLTLPFRNPFEAQARANLRRSLYQLSGTSARS